MHWCLDKQQYVFAYLHVWECVLEQPDGALAEAVRVERLLGRRGLQVVRGLMMRHDI
jgi:hypothetical protein